MCLHELVPEEKIRKHLKYGYKVFDWRWGDIYPEFFGDRPLKYNVWMLSDDKTILGKGTGALYSSGFHVFTNKKDAFVWAISSNDTWDQVVKKVLIEEVTYEGYQYYKDRLRRVVVCKGIKILPDIIER